MTRLLFSTGTARGGTNLAVKMLNVSRRAYLASDPFLPLFKSFRSAALKASLGLDVPADAPLVDHFFSDPRVLRALYAAELATPFDPRDRTALLAALAKRQALSSENLIPHLPLLEGADYKELFDRGLDMISRAAGREAEVLGLNDNWAIEFFPALARAYPDARFLVMVRDPRAAICSALRQADPSRIAPVLSFSRGWRKNVAYLERFRKDPLFAGRLLVLTYEELVREPRASVESLCRFAGVPFDDAMLEPSNFRDGGGRPWTPNTHVHAQAPAGIFQDSILAWRRQLSSEAVESIELVCGVEMERWGYEVERYQGGLLSPQAAAFLLENDKAPASWKGTGSGVERELADELARRQLLACPPEALKPETRDAYFLFAEAHDALLQRGLVNA